MKWDPQNFSTSPIHYDRWDYVDATTSNVHILTLSEIAAGCTSTSNPGYREPNFFEMLKAGILSGSVGQSPGKQCAGTNFEGVNGIGFDSFSAEKNRHILQIGVNIIDQAHTDNIPTAIYLALFGVIPPATNLTDEDDLAFNTVYGDKNLPGLTRVYPAVIEDWYDTSASKGYMKCWMVPEVWNIHQVPGTGVDQTVAGTTGHPHPTQFRVHAYGTFYWNNQVNGSTFNANPMNWDDTTTLNPFHDATASPATGTASTIYGGQIPNSNAVTSATGTTSPAGLLYFTDYGSANSPFYRYPNFLQFQNLYSVGRTAFQGTHLLNEWASPADNNMPGDGGATQVEFAGLFGGEMTLPDLTTYAGTGNMDNNVINTSPIFFSLECQDPTTLHWHPYNFMSRLVTPPGTNNSLLGDNGNAVAAAPNSNYVGTPGTGNAANGWTFTGGSNIGLRGGAIVRADPRTDRFSAYSERMRYSQPANSTMIPGPGNAQTPNAIEDRFPYRTYGFVYNPDQGSNPGGFAGGGDSFIGSWSVNTASTTASTAFYVDPDGVVRPGDAVYASNAGTTGDGQLLYHGTLGGDNQTLPPTSPSNTASTSPLTTNPTSLVPTSTTAAGASAPAGSAQARRPVILNRPFRSVGELGYAFRDLPFKTLDFFSQMSGDAALLDLFSVTDEPTVAAGQINPSNMPTSALNAILVGTTKMEINNPVATTASPTSGSDTRTSTTAPSGANFIAYNSANKLAGLLTASFNPTSVLGPLGNRADLVARIAKYNINICIINSNNANKAYAEAPVRALSGVTNTRTWNLLIDIIAQSGEMSPTATSLNDFVVQGEKRYWLHIAIDRYTGKIIDQQLEPVYE